MDSTRPQAKGRAQAGRVQLGEFWLYFRAERGEWFIASYDAAARRTRRIATGIRGSPGDDPPHAAQAALAAHFARHAAPERERLDPGEARVLPILTAWLQGPAEQTRRAAAYGYAVLQWTAFFEREAAAGRLAASPSVAAINKKLCERFITDRLAAGRSPETIRGDLAALRAALRWAHREERIAAFPFIPDVPADLRRGPRDQVFEIAELGKLLTAARAREDRRHVFDFAMGILAGFGRVEAVLECDLDTQLDRRRWLISWLAPGERQTSKRRSLIPVAPIWRPWLEDRSGKLVRYQVARKDGGTFERETASIKRAWRETLAEAGIAYRSPNVLRHTLISEMHARGVPESQIELASGHAGEGTNKRNYRHLRPEYLRELIAGIESLFLDLDQHTQAHLRSQRDPKVVPIDQAVSGK